MMEPVHAVFLCPSKEAVAKGDLQYGLGVVTVPGGHTPSVARRGMNPLPTWHHQIGFATSSKGVVGSSKIPPFSFFPLLLFYNRRRLTPINPAKTNNQ
jgi:hypothetical protein